MSDSTSQTRNRAARRSAARRARSATVAGAAAAALTVGVAIAPPAQAADLTVNWDPAYTAGGLAGILNFIGNASPGLDLAGLYNSGPPQQINISLPDVAPPIVNTVFLNLFLKYLTNSSTAGLYNTIANIPAPGSCTIAATNCRYALMLGTSEATYNLVDAYRAQIESVTTGTSRAGFIPFTASPGSTSARPTQTDQALVFLQNPVRPNGGLMSRFPDISEALGFNPTMPAAGKYTSADGKVALVTSTIDATWAYDPIGDFPAVFNLTAIANSFAAGLPLNLLGGLADPGYVISDAAGNEVKVDDVGINLAVLLQLGGILSGLLGPLEGKGFYATIVPEQLPILTPLRLPGLGINAVLGALNSPYLLGNPVADALEPALRILVNIAYDDVVTPTEGGTYNRTFLKGATPTPFGSVDPLTEEERAAVPGDVWDALVGGIQEQLAKPFWGILVPANPQEEQVTPPAAVQDTATALPAATEPAEASLAATAVAEELAPASEPAASEPASAPEAEPEAAPEPATAPKVAVSEPDSAVVSLDDEPDVGVLDDHAAEADPGAADGDAAADAPAATAGATRGGDLSGRRGAAAESADEGASSDRGRSAE